MFLQKKPSLRVTSGDIGKSFSVLSGKALISLIVTELMVGFRFGQFVLTKKLGSVIHTKKSRKSRKKR